MNSPFRIAYNHHAYSVRGDAHAAREMLWKLFETEWGIETRGNPDFSDETLVSFSVDDARNLRERAERKALGEGRKVFVVEADMITSQAQNALLKLFEDPPEHTHFFLLGRATDHLIPTLLSRLVVLETSAVPETRGRDARAFLAASLPARLALAKKLADDIRDEKKTKADAKTLVEDIETLLYRSGKPKREELKMLEDVELCRDYLRDSGASVKMLLDYVAIMIPAGIKLQD